MRLTNTLRQAFVRAALDDVPRIDYSQQIIDVAIADAARQLPPKIKAIFDDKKLREFIKTCNVDVGPFYSEVPTCLERYDFNFTSEGQAKLDKLEELYKAQNETIRNLRVKLEGAANAASTRKALIEMLPEFERYLPPDEAAVNKQLPSVVGILNDFVAAGWPKEKEAA